MASGATWRQKRLQSRKALESQRELVCRKFSGSTCRYRSQPCVGPLSLVGHSRLSRISALLPAVGVLWCGRYLHFGRMIQSAYKAVVFDLAFGLAKLGLGSSGCRRFSITRCTRGKFCRSWLSVATFPGCPCVQDAREGGTAPRRTSSDNPRVYLSSLLVSPILSTKTVSGNLCLTDSSRGSFKEAIAAESVPTMLPGEADSLLESADDSLRPLAPVGKYT